MRKSRSIVFCLIVGISMVIALTACSKHDAADAFFEAPQPEDEGFLDYYGLENPFDHEYTINEELKMVFDGRDPIMMDEYSVQYAPLLEDGGVCSAWICLAPSSLPGSAYFAEDGYIYDHETPGIWEFEWDENQKEKWTLRKFHTKEPAD